MVTEWNIIYDMKRENRSENDKWQRHFSSSFGQSQSGTGERVSVRVTGDTVQWARVAAADIHLETSHVTRLGSVKEEPSLSISHRLVCPLSKALKDDVYGFLWPRIALNSCQQLTAVPPRILNIPTQVRPTSETVFHVTRYCVVLKSALFKFLKNISLLTLNPCEKKKEKEKCGQKFDCVGPILRDSSTKHKAGCKATHQSNWIYHWLCFLCEALETNLAFCTLMEEAG